MKNNFLKIIVAINFLAIGTILSAKVEVSEKTIDKWIKTLDRKFLSALNEKVYIPAQPKTSADEKRSKEKIDEAVAECYTNLILIEGAFYYNAFPQMPDKELLEKVIKARFQELQELVETDQAILASMPADIQRLVRAVETQITILENSLATTSLFDLNLNTTRLHMMHRTIDKLLNTTHAITEPSGIFKKKDSKLKEKIEKYIERKFEPLNSPLQAKRYELFQASRENQRENQDDQNLADIKRAYTELITCLAQAKKTSNIGEKAVYLVQAYVYQIFFIETVEEMERYGKSTKELAKDLALASGTNFDKSFIVNLYDEKISPERIALIEHIEKLSEKEQNALSEDAKVAIDLLQAMPKKMTEEFDSKVDSNAY